MFTLIFMIICLRIKDLPLFPIEELEPMYIEHVYIPAVLLAVSLVMYTGLYAITHRESFPVKKDSTFLVIFLSSAIFFFMLHLTVCCVSHQENISTVMNYVVLIGLLLVCFMYFLRILADCKGNIFRAVAEFVMDEIPAFVSIFVVVIALALFIQASVIALILLILIFRWIMD